MRYNNNAFEKERANDASELTYERDIADERKVTVNRRARATEMMLDKPVVTKKVKVVSRAALEYNEKREWKFQPSAWKGEGWKELFALTVIPMAPMKITNIHTWCKSKAAENDAAVERTVNLILAAGKHRPMTCFAENEWCDNFDYGVFGGEQKHVVVESGWKPGPIVGKMNLTWKDIKSKAATPLYTFCAGDVVMVIDRAIAVACESMGIDIAEDICLHHQWGKMATAIARAYNSRFEGRRRTGAKKEFVEPAPRLVVSETGELVANTDSARCLAELWNKLMHSVNGNIEFPANLQVEVVKIGEKEFVAVNEKDQGVKFYVPMGDCLAELEDTQLLGEAFQPVCFNGDWVWVPKCKEVGDYLAGPLANYAATKGARSTYVNWLAWCSAHGVDAWGEPKPDSAVEQKSKKATESMREKSIEEARKAAAERERAAEEEKKVKAAAEDEDAGLKERTKKDAPAADHDGRVFALSNLDLNALMNLKERLEYQRADDRGKAEVIERAFNRLRKPGDWLRLLRCKERHTEVPKFDERLHGERSTDTYDDGMYELMTVDEECYDIMPFDSWADAIYRFALLALMTVWWTIVSLFDPTAKRPVPKVMKSTRRFTVFADSFDEACNGKVYGGRGDPTTRWEAMKNKVVRFKTAAHPRKLGSMEGLDDNTLYLTRAFFYTRNLVDPAGFQEAGTSGCSTDTTYATSTCRSWTQLSAPCLSVVEDEVSPMLLRWRTLLVSCLVATLILVLIGALVGTRYLGFASVLAGNAVLTLMISSADSLSSQMPMFAGPMNPCLLMQILALLVGWRIPITVCRGVWVSYEKRATLGSILWTLAAGLWTGNVWTVLQHSSNPSRTPTTSTPVSSTAGQTTPSVCMALLLSLLSASFIHAMLILSSMCLYLPDPASFVAACLGLQSTWSRIIVHLSLISLLSLCLLVSSFCTGTCYLASLTTTAWILGTARTLCASFLLSLVGIGCALVMFGCVSTGLACLARCSPRSGTDSPISFSWSTYSPDEGFKEYEASLRGMTGFSRFQPDTATESQPKKTSPHSDFTSNSPSESGSKKPASAAWSTMSTRGTSSVRWSQHCSIWDGMTGKCRTCKNALDCFMRNAYQRFMSAPAAQSSLLSRLQSAIGAARESSTRIGAAIREMSTSASSWMASMTGYDVDDLAQWWKTQTESLSRSSSEYLSDSSAAARRELAEAYEKLNALKTSVESSIRANSQSSLNSAARRVSDFTEKATSAAARVSSAIHSAADAGREAYQTGYSYSQVKENARKSGMESAPGKCWALLSVLAYLAIIAFATGIIRNRIPIPAQLTASAIQTALVGGVLDSEWSRPAILATAALELIHEGAALFLRCLVITPVLMTVMLKALWRMSCATKPTEGNATDADTAETSLKRLENGRLRESCAQLLRWAVTPMGSMMECSWATQLANRLMEMWSSLFSDSWELTLYE